MNAAQPDTPLLRELIAASPGLRLDDPVASLFGNEIGASTALACQRRDLAGKSVLIGAKAQLVSARALIELDGLAARLVICPPDFSPERLASVIEQAQVDAIICDTAQGNFGVARPIILCGEPIAREDNVSFPRLESQWLLPTSGTTGPPKLVAHSLRSLLGAIGAASQEAPPVWATFYDIRRYGGLQIFLRACVTGARLVLSVAGETLDDFVARCGEAGVTHISGTPSHWRRLLMSPSFNMIDPKYVRLSGEIADRAVLGALRAAYQNARVVHAYASTEAGVGFEVVDGQEGFPASFLEAKGDVELRLRDGSLHIRSTRTAVSYIGRDDLKLRDDDGFVDTDDMVEQKGDRCFFKGRRAGVINVGGLKVHPEEVERVINAHDKVRMSRVSARRSPIMGDIIVADVVLKESEAPVQSEALKLEILDACRDQLARHMVPVTMRFIPALDLLANGKLARHHA
jgi:acyl-coenzyme A synthetase/AMP-(fatty) acid ligase